MTELLGDGSARESEDDNEPREFLKYTFYKVRPEWRLLAADTKKQQKAEFSALVHDLGRVAVANTVWDKPGALTRDERDRAEFHALVTDQLLRRLPYTAGLADVTARARGGARDAQAAALDPDEAGVVQGDGQGEAGLGDDIVDGDRTGRLGLLVWGLVWGTVGVPVPLRRGHAGAELRVSAALLGQRSKYRVTCLPHRRILS